ncbi:hypothetical protein EZS27_012696 [termite gut metagenome]|uniref:DUF4465 domain-containing protein n=1 Tax=termite gut metagenome TaxID=433724 RepID=A0A5J4RZL0_9ZZZZ
MKKLYVLTLLSVLFAFYGCQKDDETIVVNFEGLLSGANQEFITSNGVKANEDDPYSSYKGNFEDPLHILQFDHYYYNPEGGSFGGGFTYTNSTNNSTPGYSNIGVCTAGGHSGNTYLTAYIDNIFAPSQITNLQSDKYKFTGAWITNSTYAYLAIKDGNDGGLGAARQFKAEDSFVLTAIGYDSHNNLIGKVSFYLADFRSGKKNLIDKWVWVDFTPVASAEYIKFEMFSTDTGDFGMNTPSYFCMDDITLTEK